MNHTQTQLAAGFLIFLICLGSFIPLLTSSVAVAWTTDDEKHADADVSETIFERRIAVLMRLAGFSGLSACVIINDDITWSQGYGYYDRVEKKPATPDTIYVLASITKTIVGTALLQLYEQGLFDLDDDVNTVLPFELRNPHFPDDSITFRMLLSHTSSLNKNIQQEYYWFNFSGDPPFTFFPEPYLQEFLIPGGRFFDSSVWSSQYRPGEHAMYANVGYDLISYLVELLACTDFLTYCESMIFSPLGMYNTSFNLSTLDIEQVAIPYQRYGGRYFMINELEFLFGDQTPSDRYWRGRFYPAGGLYSTVADLSCFLIAHMNEGVYKDVRILEKETVELMHELQPDNRIGYGLGWKHFSITPRLSASGHGGDLHGCDTWMLYTSTSSGPVGVIYLANGNPAYSRLPRIGALAFRLILASLFQKQGGLSTELSLESRVPSEGFLARPQMVPYRLLC